MNVMEIGGVKISYASVQGLGKSVEDELAKTNSKIADALRGLKRLRRTQRALRQMLGGPRNKSAQPVVGEGAPAREAASVLR